MPSLFKSGDELLDQGLDLSRRRDFVKAREKFLDASRKLSKEGGTIYVDVARAYADLMLLSSPNPDPTLMANLAGYLRSTVGTFELRPGARGITGADLATQLQLEARDRNLSASLQSGQGDPNGLAQALQALANDYMQLGNQVLFLPELFQQQSVTADLRVPVLMALSFETLGRGVMHTDPMAAAEHFQTAQQYWSQAGDSSRAAVAAGQIERLSLQAKCWFCGREGAGHGVQFVSMPVDLDVSGLKGHDGSPLPSLDKAGTHLYVCKACNSAVRVLADRIASERSAQVAHQLRAEMAAMERRLQSQIPQTSR